MGVTNLGSGNCTSTELEHWIAQEMWRWRMPVLSALQHSEDAEENSSTPKGDVSTAAKVTQENI